MGFVGASRRDALGEPSACPYILPHSPAFSIGYYVRMTSLIPEVTGFFLSTPPGLWYNLTQTIQAVLSPAVGLLCEAMYGRPDVVG
jgi:hypothetical protein